MSICDKGLLGDYRVLLSFNDSSFDVWIARTTHNERLTLSASCCKYLRFLHSHNNQSSSGLMR